MREYDRHKRSDEPTAKYFQKRPGWNYILKRAGLEVQPSFRERKEPIPAAVLSEILQPLVERNSLRQVSEETDIHPRRIRSILKQEQKTVTVRKADKILTGLGCPELLTIILEAPP